MTLINFLFVIFNILLLIFGYIFIKKKTEKMVINKEILDDIKKEVNSMIIKLNETTINNISLIEEKARRLEKLIKLADRKTSGLDEKIIENQDELESFSSKLDSIAYSPQKIVKQTAKISEIKYNEEIINKIETVEIEDKIKGMSVNEKVRFMLGEGYSTEEIKKKIGLSAGELELILNIENIKDF